VTRSTKPLTHAGQFSYIPDSPAPHYHCEMPSHLQNARCQALRVVALLPVYLSTIDLKLTQTRFHVAISITPRRAIHERYATAYVSPRHRAAIGLRWHILPRRAKEILRGLDEALLLTEVPPNEQEDRYRFRTKKPNLEDPFVQRATLSLPRSTLRADPPLVSSIEQFLNVTVDRDAYADTLIGYRVVVTR
jgi:hypothetical protein